MEEKRVEQNGIKKSEPHLILNLFKVGGKIQTSQVETKIKSFLLGERVDVNQFSNEINSIHFFFFIHLQSD